MLLKKVSRAGKDIKGQSLMFEFKGMERRQSFVIKANLHDIETSLESCAREGTRLFCRTKGRRGQFFIKRIDDLGRVILQDDDGLIAVGPDKILWVKRKRVKS